MEAPQNRENEFLDLLHLLSLKGSPWSVVSLRQMIVRSSKLPSGGEITTLASLPFNKIINFLNCSNRMDFDLQDVPTPTLSSSTKIKREKGGKDASRPSRSINPTPYTINSPKPL